MTKRQHYDTDQCFNILRVFKNGTLRRNDGFTTMYDRHSLQKKYFLSLKKLLNTLTPFK